MAESLSWMEHGPTMIINRGSLPSRMFMICCRARTTWSTEARDIGSWDLISSGDGSGDMLKIFRLSLFINKPVFLI